MYYFPNKSSNFSKIKQSLNNVTKRSTSLVLKILALCSDNPFLHYIASVKPVFSLVSYVILIKMKQFVFLLFVFASSNSAKVENWSNPNLEGSLQPNSIKSSARNGKFLGTYGITVRFLFFAPFFAKNLILFYSQSTTTTTKSAYTYCYTSAAAISTVCDRKKKRSIEDAPIDGKSIRRNFTKIVT